MMIAWQTAAALGAGLGFLGSLVGPRWMEKRPAGWERWAVTGITAVITGLLATTASSAAYFWHQLPFLLVLILSSWVDLHDRIIPNELLLFGLAAGLLMQWLLPYPEKTWVDAFLALAAGFGFFLILMLLAPGGMGMGDAKLAAVMGFYLGAWWIGMGLMLGFLSGGLVGGLLLLFRVVSRKDYIPFGPFLAFGSILTLLYGRSIWIWYTAFY